MTTLGDPTLLTRSAALYAVAPRYRLATPSLAFDGSPLVEFAEPRRKIAVFSHERSGTHFLMNTIAQNFGYVSDPWWNLDFEEGLCLHAPGFVLGYFEAARDRPVQNILKAHHAAGFFTEIIEPMAEMFDIFYIYRDPRQVMPSYWRLIRDFPWDEGPRTPTVQAFVEARPRGNMLRYQKESADDVLDRWQRHVDGWTALAHTSGRVLTLDFGALDRRFDETVARIARHLGRKAPETPRRPSRDVAVVHPTRGAGRATLDADTHALITDRTRDTLARLGIAP